MDSDRVHMESNTDSTMYHILIQMQNEFLEFGFAFGYLQDFVDNILPPSQYISNHLWFKDQGMHLILSLNTNITASIYTYLERAALGHSQCRNHHSFYGH